MTNVSHEPAPSTACQICGAPIWLAVFTGERVRAVEVAPLVRRLGAFARPAGKIALQFPLVEGEPVRGVRVRKLTRFRLHQHAKPGAHVPPVVTPIGNLHDVLASTCTGGSK